MKYVGIDIGSTSAKLAILDENKNIIKTDVRATGWSSLDTAKTIEKDLEDFKSGPNDSKIVATGYGRISVPFAHKQITEITCHAIGAAYLFDSRDLFVIDIGGQDTKAIRVKDGMVSDFAMNDKCSAGTGRFLEVMSNALGINVDDMCEMAKSGSNTSISSMCTVFAESEVVSLIGRGESKENIAFAVVESVVDKVISQAAKLYEKEAVIALTGGLCECEYIIKRLSSKLGNEVISNPNARYAGAIGAAISAMKL